MAGWEAVAWGVGGIAVGVVLGGGALIVFLRWVLRDPSSWGPRF